MVKKNITAFAVANLLNEPRNSQYLSLLLLLFVYIYRSRDSIYFTFTGLAYQIQRKDTEILLMNPLFICKFHGLLL